MTDQPDTDIEAIQRTATAVIDSLYSASDLTAVRDQIAIDCEHQPTRMAQVIMCLAAWSNIHETTGQRDARVEQLVVLRECLFSPREPDSELEAIEP